MKTLRFSWLLYCMFACSTIFICSCNKADKDKIAGSMDAVDAYYAPSVLTSKAITGLPDYTSKEKLVKVLLELAKKKHNTSEVQITDLYLHPDFDGLEFFYRLPNGEETNALLVDAKSLGKIEVYADQLNLEFNDKKDSKLILGDDYALLKSEVLTLDRSSVLFTCDNEKNCSPCQVVVHSSEISSSRKTVRCGSCEGCSLKAEIIEEDIR